MLLATTLALVLPVLVGFVVAAVFEGIAVLGVEDGGGGVEGLRDGETTPKKANKKSVQKSHQNKGEKQGYPVMRGKSPVPKSRSCVKMLLYILTS